VCCGAFFVLCRLKKIISFTGAQPGGNVGLLRPNPRVEPNFFRLIKLLMCKPNKCFSANQTNCLGQGHQHGARGQQVAHTDHFSRPRACSDNSINMISVFTLINVFNFY